MKRIKFSPTLGHLTNFCTNFYEFFNFGKFVKIREFFAEVTNSRSMQLSVPGRVCLQRSGGERSCRGVAQERRLRRRRSRLRRASRRTRPGRHQPDVLASRTRRTLSHVTRRHPVHAARPSTRSVPPRRRWASSCDRTLGPVIK